MFVSPAGMTILAFVFFGTYMVVFTLVQLFVGAWLGDYGTYGLTYLIHTALIQGGIAALSGSSGGYHTPTSPPYFETEAMALLRWFDEFEDESSTS